MEFLGQRAFQYSIPVVHRCQLFQIRFGDTKPHPLTTPPLCNKLVIIQNIYTFRSSILAFCSLQAWSLHLKHDKAKGHTAYPIIG